MLFVDATGTLLSYGSTPTGIPRIEDFLVRAALADPDPAVVVVRFERRRRRYRRLNILERQQLSGPPPSVNVDSERASRTEILGQVFKIIRKNPTVGREADRHFADLIAKNGRRGYFYAGAKLLFRTYRVYRRCLALVTLNYSATIGEPVDPRQGTVLMSNAVIFGSLMSRAFSATKRRAFICHDLIPVLRPEFAIDSDHAKRFSENLDRAVRSNVAAICTSDSSSSMLSEYLRSAGGERLHIYRFPMPSILHERANQVGRASRSKPSEPFILYCSTIEGRKNHILLARIWQQAFEESVALPRLICIGKWGWGVDELRAYLAAHPALASRIIFTGPVTDNELIKYYRSALFGVVPSYVEGWGYGASECLDFGIPVIVSTAPALEEATHGMMPAIDPDDQAGWYAEMRRMVEDDERRARLSKQIAERHRPTPTAASWTSIKNALCHSGTAGMS
jgi:glycosyltransferase involved in cell wall biosynthesis